MLTTDITEINAMPVACIFANAFYIGVVRTGLILIAENISGIYMCLPETVGKKEFKSLKLEIIHFGFCSTLERNSLMGKLVLIVSFS